MIEKSGIYDIMTTSVKQKGESVMFCKHCGATVEEGNLHCSSCGMPVGEVAQPAPEQEVVTPVEETVYQEPVQQSEPVISLNTEAKPAKPKKKGKIIAIAIIAVLLVGAILVALNFSAIKVWFSRTFSSPEEIMTAVYKDGVTEIFHSFSGTYDKISEITENGDQTVEGDIRLKLGSQITGMLGQLFSDELNTSEDSASWLSDIVIAAKQTQNGDMSQYNMALCFGDTTIISLDTIFDGTANKQWISVPELNDQSFYIDTHTDLMSGAAYSAIGTNPLTSVVSFDLLESVYSQFADFMLEYMGDVETETKSFTVGDVTEDIYVLETKFTEETMIQISIRMLEALKQDAELKKCLDEYSAQYKQEMEALWKEIGMDPSDMPEMDLYADFIARMDEEIASLQSKIADAKAENYLVLYTYLNSDNGFAGFELEVFGSDSNLDKIRTLKVKDGDRYAQELVLGDLLITGSGTEGDLLNAAYSIYAPEEVLSFEIKDGKITDDRISGTLRIIPGEMMMDGIGASMDSASSAMLQFADLALEIQLDYGKTDAMSKVSLCLGSMEFISIEANSAMKPAETITAPENGVNAADDTQMEAWVNNIDLQKVWDNLVEAGFPEDLLTMIYQEIMSGVM